MPKLVRLYIQSVAIGFSIAAAFVGVLFWSDAGGFGALVMRSGAVGVVAIIMALVFFGSMFSGVQFAYRIMGMAENDTPPSGGKRDRIDLKLAPVKAAQHAEARNPLRKPTDPQS